MSKFRHNSDGKFSLRNTKNKENPKDKRFEKLDEFLRANKIEEYLSVFKENEIVFEDLKFLKETDVAELNLPIGPRNRLLNALENIDEDEAEEERKEAMGQFARLKEIYMVVGEISQKQDEMIVSIKKCRDELNELKEEYAEIQCNQSSTMRHQKENFASTSPKVGRVAKPTLSSIAKQKVLPNKYMQVSPLRASYYSKLMN